MATASTELVALQLNVDASQIDGYAARQHSVSDHQESIRDCLKPAVFDTDRAEALARFVLEESCRLEQTAALLARARELLKGRRDLVPADSALLRLAGEQRKRACEHIVSKLAGGLSPSLVQALDGLLEVKEGQAISGLQTPYVLERAQGRRRACLEHIFAAIWAALTHAASTVAPGVQPVIETR